MLPNHNKHIDYDTQVGARLDNGTTFIAILGNTETGRDFVLASDPKNAHAKYIVWVLAPNGSTENGDYYRDLKDAVTGFYARAFEIGS